MLLKLPDLCLILKLETKHLHFNATSTLTLWLHLANDARVEFHLMGMQSVLLSWHLGHQILV